MHKHTSSNLSSRIIIRKAIYSVKEIDFTRFSDCSRTLETRCSQEARVSLHKLKLCKTVYFRDGTPRTISPGDTFSKAVIHRYSTAPRATEIASAIVTPAYSFAPKRSFGPNATRDCKSAKCVAYRYHPLHMRIRSAKKSQLGRYFRADYTTHLQIRDGRVASWY